MIFSMNSAGHLLAGNDKIAMVGTKKENVPPCTIGNLILKKKHTF